MHVIFGAIVAALKFLRVFFGPDKWNQPWTGKHYSNWNKYMRKWMKDMSTHRQTEIAIKWKWNWIITQLFDDDKRADSDLICVEFNLSTVYWFIHADFARNELSQLYDQTNSTNERFLGWIRRVTFDCVEKIKFNSVQMFVVITINERLRFWVTFKDQDAALCA